MAADSATVAQSESLSRSLPAATPSVESIYSGRVDLEERGHFFELATVATADFQDAVGMRPKGAQHILERFDFEARTGTLQSIPIFEIRALASLASKSHV
ncbi:hypothetical protein AB8Z38_00185 [Bradyrhizobium sp. LLZ17]|uniref:Uncharacterized protein n=1 Tax=Bradyrhizobium sp. LLZ17 TaxID=3239388 RepID=A0AB39XJE5_9BRAD